MSGYLQYIFENLTKGQHDEDRTIATAIAAQGVLPQSSVGGCRVTRS